MGDKLVTVATFNDSILASLAKQSLDEAGIESILSGQNFANILPVNVFAIELQVAQSQSQKALDVLKTHNNREQ